MKIVVCVKEVVDVSFSFALDQTTLEPLAEDLFYKVNPVDRCAAEVALSLRDACGAEVIYLSFGPPRVEKALRECLSMGGDRAVRVWDAATAAGSQAKAYLLAQAVQTLSPDLVLCGSRSFDEGSGETPAALAEFLSLPQVVGVTELALAPDQSRATVSRKLERGRREAIECPLPALLAVEEGIAQPRYAAMPQRLQAYKAPIEVLDAAQTGADMAVLRQLHGLRSPVRRALPRPRPKKTFNMESGLTAEQRMELMMSGGARKEKSDLLEGAPQELARQLTDIVREKLPKHS